jgi:membrane-associated phospholipid phosphatase
MTDVTASAALSLSRRRIAEFAPLLRQSFAAHWLVIAVPLIAQLPVELTLATIEEPQRRGLLSLFVDMMTVSLPTALLAIGMLRLLQMLLFEKPASPMLALIGDLYSVVRNPGRLVNGIPVILGVLLCTRAMLDIKQNIPAIHPFSWDEAMMLFDRQLHGGIDPWLWLQPVLGYAPVSFIINMNYNIWLAILFGSWVYVAFQVKFDLVRQQFLIAFMLSWLVGGALLAVIFSSAGPVYYGLIGLSPDPYAPLLDYLHTTDQTVPILALNMQQLLWDGYIGKITPYLGISAFPSMHNALATLFALLAWRLNRVAGIVMTVFAGLILIGSVHLAWHYAVDSYAGILIGLTSWWIAGYLARWNMSLPHVRRYRIDLERAAR